MKKPDPKISKVNVVLAWLTSWPYLPSRYTLWALKRKSKIIHLIFKFLNFFFYTKRRFRLFFKIFHKQYPEAGVLYRYIVWSSLWNILFWHLFGEYSFYTFYFLKLGFDVVFFLKFISLFFSGKNFDMAIQEALTLFRKIVDIFLIFKIK